MLLIIGDFNKHIGNDEFGVAGNHSKISYGGELLRGLLSSSKYVCLNNSNIAKGDPLHAMSLVSRVIENICHV